MNIRPARHRQNGLLSTYYPQTARGQLRPGPREQVFDAGGIGFVGPTDGTMVPIEVANLEAMPENIWTQGKIDALVQAAQQGRHPLVHPGYADLGVEDGALHAQVRDGNHRTFAAVEAGAEVVWVLMSDSTRQDIDERRSSEQLYRAIRRAQAEQGAPLFHRQRIRVRQTPAVVRLRAAEAEVLRLYRVREQVALAQLEWLGPVEDTGWSPEEQRARPDLFVRMRLAELRGRLGRPGVLDLLEEPAWQALAEQENQAYAAMRALDIYDMRKAAGLNPARERLDPVTGMVVLA